MELGVNTSLLLPAFAVHSPPAVKISRSPRLASPRISLISFEASVTVIASSSFAGMEVLKLCQLAGWLIQSVWGLRFVFASTNLS